MSNSEETERRHTVASHAMETPKTLYDWYPGQRLKLLAPKGSKSKLRSIVVGVGGGDVFRELYDGGRLTGRALGDARLKYEGKVDNQNE